MFSYRLLFLVSFYSLYAEPTVYQTLSNLYHPSRSDYQKIQKYLKKGDRQELNLLKEAIEPGGALHDYKSRVRRIHFVGKWPWQGPRFGIVPFGCSLNDKKICVVTYASYNQNYPVGVSLIEEALKKVGFKGHFVYRIGGWPDLEGGSLKLAHVPYAFKPCFLRELGRLGYELVLWLDTSIRPMKNLDSVFKTIEEQGYLFYRSGHTLAQYCTKEAMEALGEPIENAEHIYSVAAGVFGVNLRHEQGQKLVQKWYEAAQKETPFLSPRPEQNALSILSHQMKLTNWEREGLVWQREACNESTLFLIDSKSIQ